MLKKNSLNIIFYLMLFLLVNIIFYINNNLFKWMIMEIFSLIFISMMNFNESHKIPSIIYFLISSISSMILFFNITIFMNYWFQLMIYKNIFFSINLSTFLTQISLILKLGIFPFHMWMIYLFQFMSWSNIFVFSTINKIIPIYLLTSLSNMNNLFMMMIILNSLMSSILAMTEMSMKKIFGYSSMNHSSYLIILSSLNSHMFMIYMFMYLTNSFMMMSLFNKFKLNNKLKLINVFNYNKFNNLYLIFIFSYSMLPPMIFFTIKWFFFYETIMINNSNFYLIMMMISSILMTWNYLNLSNYQLMSYKLTKKNLLVYNNYYKNYFILMIISMLMNFFIMVYLFY